MTTSEIKNRCSRCLGTGEDSNLTPPGPCVPCGGTGFVARDAIDTTNIMAELDYIHGKVKKIWNKVKDGAPEE